jgi:hypothetical protein
MIDVAVTAIGRLASAGVHMGPEFLLALAALVVTLLVATTR